MGVRRALVAVAVLLALVALCPPPAHASLWDIDALRDKVASSDLRFVLIAGRLILVVQLIVLGVILLRRRRARGRPPGDAQGP